MYWTYNFIDILNMTLFFLCRAEAETKLKLEKVAEIKKINAQMMAIKRYNYLSLAICSLL